MKLRDAQREIEKLNYLGENNPLNDIINEGPGSWATRQAGRALYWPPTAATTAAGAYTGNYAANLDGLPYDADENPWVDLGATATGGYVGSKIPSPIKSIGKKLIKKGKEAKAKAKAKAQVPAEPKLPNTWDNNPFIDDTLGIDDQKPKAPATVKQPQPINVTVNTPQQVVQPDPRLDQLEKDLNKLLNQNKDLEVRLLKAQQQGNDRLAKKLKAQNDSVEKKIGNLEKKVNIKPAPAPTTTSTPAPASTTTSNWKYNWTPDQEKDALERFARQGKVTGITDEMIAKEIRNPTQLPPKVVQQQAQVNASQIAKQADGVKISTTNPLAGSQSIKIGGQETAEQVAKQVLSKEVLEKMGIVTSASNSMFKQTVKQAAKKGAAYLGLSLVPILNVALLGHDVYAATTAVSKAIDPDTQDKVDAGRHRQVALQQMSQVMMSDAPMDAKIEQIEYLFSDKVTETTLPELQAQINAGIQPQHFVTANPEFQAQLDKGPQPLTVRNENIWNSSYDDKEKILPVTFDNAGNIAVGPNTKADFESVLDDLMTRMETLNAYRQRLPRNAQVPPGYTSQVESVKNSISQVRTAMKNAPDDRKTAFKNYVFSTLAQTEAMVAANESAILKGTMIVEGPIDKWLAKYRNWATDKENLPKSGGAIRGKTSLGKKTKNLDPSEIKRLKTMQPGGEWEGNTLKVTGVPQHKDPGHYGYKEPIVNLPDEVAKAKAPEVNVNDIKAKQTGQKVGSAISQAVGSIKAEKPNYSKEEQDMLAKIKAKSKKYSKYSKAEQALMIKAGLIKNTFKQAFAQAKKDSANLKTMKLKNGKTLKYFVWNGKKYAV